MIPVFLGKAGRQFDDAGDRERYPEPSERRDFDRGPAVELGCRPRDLISRVHELFEQQEKQ